jgi:Flp pilus assembly pilin Flp
MPSQMPFQLNGSRSQQGQGLLEYGLIMFFVILVVFGGLLLVGPAVLHVLQDVNQAL